MEYKSETKICQNCKGNFTIEPDDFSFYEKIKVPPPTFCPECRMIRRLSFINNWNIYWRNCDKCGKKTLSKYSTNDPILFYCQECWWSDEWDGTEYGIDYDPKRPFLAQMKDLQSKTPRVALDNLYTTIKNCEYVNGVSWSKDCYLIYWADYCENVYYSSFLNNLKYSLDCLRGYYSELCYESIGFSRCYRIFFSEECDDCLNVWFSRNCYNCQNCIGCANLSGASYCILNEKYTKEEYENKLKDLNLKSWENIQNVLGKAKEFWLTRPYRAFHGHSLNYNVTGDYVYTSKNSKECYILNGAENCKWCQFITVSPIKDCYDYTGWGDNTSQIYESTSIGENSDSVRFSYSCFTDCLNLQYCFCNISCKNSFGCINMKRKQYCILNKEYSKDDFNKLKGKILEDMKVNSYVDKQGWSYSYGDFFPAEFSEFPYNKSNAMRFFPKSREEALKEGYRWDDSEKKTGESTIKSSELPDNINETDDSILQEAIECMSCQRVYNIASGELDLLRKLQLPTPHECPKCRENKRFDSMNKPTKLHNRKCAKCHADVYTPYSPDRPEIIYCEKCYQQEVF